MADILYQDKCEIPVGTDIMCVVDSQESYIVHIQKKAKAAAASAVAHADTETSATTEEGDPQEDKKEHQESTDIIDCLRAIKHLVKSEKLKLDHGMYTIGSCCCTCFSNLSSHVVCVCVGITYIDGLQVLLGMARHGDPALMQIFQVSCEAAGYHPDTFDADFFIMNMESIIRDRVAESEVESVTTTPAVPSDTKP